MISLRRPSTAVPPELWRVVADAWSFASWVVGAARVDAVGGGWPEPDGYLHVIRARNRETLRRPALLAERPS